MSLLSQQPVDFLSPDHQLKKLCLHTLSDLFTQVKTSTHFSDEDLILPQLYTDGFGLGDIWEQIQLVNDPLINRLRKQFKSRTSLLLTDEERWGPVSNSMREKEEEEDDAGLVEDEKMEEECDVVSEEANDDDYGPCEGEGEEGEGEEEEEGEEGDRFFDLTHMEEFLKQEEHKKGQK